MSKSGTLIALLGPTASGKTSLSIELAEWLGTEIISCDSRQFFKELKIGAAPPSEAELDRVRHHFVGNLNIQQEYNAGKFEIDALPVIQDIITLKGTAIMVGGSGMYARAIFQGFDELPKADPELREELARQVRELGLTDLRDELKRKDPLTHSTIDLNNPQRVIRAIEVIRSTGQPYSKLRKGTPKRRDFHIIKVALDLDRESLYQRINERVDKMIDSGLVEEARDLFPYRDHNALQTVGYRELFMYFNGTLSLEEAIDKIKRNTRNFAKRQITWFKKEPGIIWAKPHEVQRTVEIMLKSQENEG